MIQELISVGFAVEFVLEHLREVARAFFMRRVQPAVEAIDARIELLKKEVADLEGRREHLLSGVSGPSHFRDQSLISGLHDDGAVSFPFLCFSVSLFLLCHTEHFYVSCRSYLACVCHSLGL